jgi:hypothetical protein
LALLLPYHAADEVFDWNVTGFDAAVAGGQKNAPASFSDRIGRGFTARGIAMRKHEGSVDLAPTAGPQVRTRRQMMKAASVLAAVLPLGGCEFVQILEGARNRPPARRGTTGGGNNDGGGGQQGGGGGTY